MQAVLRILFILLMLQLAACSSDSLKRNTYQSLQTIQQQQCLRQPGKDCPAPQSYDVYQQQRKQAIKK